MNPAFRRIAKIAARLHQSGSDAKTAWSKLGPDVRKRFMQQAREKLSQAKKAHARRRAPEMSRQMQARLRALDAPDRLGRRRAARDYGAAREARRDFTLAERRGPVRSRTRSRSATLRSEESMGRPLSGNFGAIVGLGFGYAAGSFAANVFGQAFYGERDRRYSMTDVGERMLLSPPSRPEGFGGGGTIFSGANGAAMGIAGLGAATGLGVAKFAFRGTNFEPPAERDLLRTRPIKRRTGSMREHLMSGQATRNAGSGLKSGANYFLRRPNMLKHAVGLGLGAAGASIAINSMQRMASSMMSVMPQRQPGYESRARNRMSSATGSRLARRSGDYSGVGATGDLVHALHRNGGRGMVVR